MAVCIHGPAGPGLFPSCVILSILFYPLRVGQPTGRKGSSSKDEQNGQDERREIGHARPMGLTKACGCETIRANGSGTERQGLFKV